MQEENNLKRLELYCALIVLFIAIIYAGLFVFNIFADFVYPQSPDSYYYMAIAEHKINDDPEFFAILCKSIGKDLSFLFLYLLMVSIPALLYWSLRRHKRDTIILLVCASYLIIPSALFINGWFQNLDKNVISAFLFVVFLKLTIGMIDKPTIINAYNKTWSINWEYFSVVGLCIFLPVAWYLWGGAWIFVIYAALFLWFDLIISKHHWHWKIIASLCLLFVGLYCLEYYFLMNFNIINETRLMVVHLINFEFLLLIVLVVAYYEMFKEHKHFFFLIIVCLASCLLLPRLMVFVPILLIIVACYMLSYLINCLNMDADLVLRRVFFVLFVFMVIDVFYFMAFFKSPYQSIQDYKPDCDDCTIVADWSNGYAIQYYWNVSTNRLMFHSHPVIQKQLDLWYYHNTTCENCLFVYTPQDYERIQEYLSVLELPQNKNFSIYLIKDYPIVACHNWEKCVLYH